MNQPSSPVRPPLPPGHAPAPLAAAAPAAPKSGRRWMIAGVAVVLAGLGAAAGWYFLRGGPPRVNAKIEAIARFADSAAFKALPFDRQAIYMKVLDSRRDDLRNATRARRLSEDEYQVSIEYAWFGKQLSHMERYNGLRDSSARSAYLEKLAKKKLKDKQAARAAPAEASADDLPKREQSSEKTFPLTWPAEARAQWDQYRRDLKKAEKKVEREMIAESIRNPQTQPAGKQPKAGKKSGKKSK